MTPWGYVGVPLGMCGVPSWVPLGGTLGMGVWAACGTDTQGFQGGGQGVHGGLSLSLSPSPSVPTVRLHDSISEEGFHYLVFDL